MKEEIKQRIEMIQRGEAPPGYKHTKIGIIPNDWKINRIGDIFETTSGTTPLRERSEYYLNGKYHWIKTTDLNNGFLNNTEEKITQKALDENFSCRLLPKGTVFVAMYGGFNQIGRTGLAKFEGVCNQALTAIYPRENIYLPSILLEYLNFKKYYWRKFAASSRKDPNITRNDVMDFPVFKFPLPEQSSIASILTNQDTLIELKEKLLEEKKKLKKSLMQNLLTGKVRLKGFNDEWEEVKISNLFEEYSNKNSFNFEQYTIGKNGIKKIGEIRYETDKHKTFKKNDLILGIGIEEINVNLNIEEGSCSPVYSTLNFKGNDIANINFIFYYLLDSIKKNRNKLSRKSTRREYEIIKEDFLKHKILLPSLEEQEKIAEILENQDREISLLQEEISQLKLQKKSLMQLLLTGIVRVPENMISKISDVKEEVC